MEHNGCTPEGKTINPRDWQGVLKVMERYQRLSGYVAHNLLGELNFFDSEPSFGGLFVTKDDVEGYAKPHLTAQDGNN